jgi:hypothetical protein
VYGRQALERRAPGTVETTQGDKVVGQRAAPVAGPGLERRDELRLVDQPRLEGQQPEQEFSPGVTRHAPRLSVRGLAPPLREGPADRAPLRIHRIKMRLLHDFGNASAGEFDDLDPAHGLDARRRALPGPPPRPASAVRRPLRRGLLAARPVRGPCVRAEDGGRRSSVAFAVEGR